MSAKLKNSNSNWLFIAPIRGLILTKAVNNEMKIGNVLFVSKTKLPRIRKRLGFPVTVSNLGEIGKDTPPFFKKQVDNFFNYSETYAISHFTGTPGENEKENYKKVEKAINLISLSNLGYAKRKFDNKIEIKSSEKIQDNRLLTLDKNRKQFSLGFKKLHPTQTELNDEWKTFQKSFFYWTFLKMINGEKKINTKWRNTLISSANILGKSLNSHDIPESFLRNIITLEMLLTTQNEKIEEKIIERLGYFLDWNEEWINKNLTGRIKEIYKKRCDYVHDGETESITKNDLIFTDDLLFNLLNNIVRNLDKITSKGKLVEFSEKYRCEKQLGIKSKYQFRKFEYVRKIYYNEDDIKKI